MRDNTKAHRLAECRLDDRGTVYPNMRLTDDWGVLEATNGALLSGDWHRVTLPAPIVSGNQVRGDGWTVTLNPGWTVVSGPRPGDFTLRGPGQ